MAFENEMAAQLRTKGFKANESYLKHPTLNPEEKMTEEKKAEIQKLFDDEGYTGVVLTVLKDKLTRTWINLFETISKATTTEEAQSVGRFHINNTEAGLSMENLNANNICIYISYFDEIAINEFTTQAIFKMFSLFWSFLFPLSILLCIFVTFASLKIENKYTIFESK